MLSTLAVSVLAALTSLPSIACAFNNPAGVDIWCGKAYRPTNASFNPGGWFEDPPMSSVPLLDFKIRPRMTLYIENDSVGSFLIDASISELVGQPYHHSNSSTSYSNKTEMDVTITVGNTIKLLVDTTTIEIDSIDNEIEFSLGQIPPSIEPYNVTVRGSLRQSKELVYESSTEILRLPSRSDGGSVTRLDNLYGGLSVLKGNETEWSLIFPYTYYVQWSLYWYSNLSTLDEFASKGYNVIHIVPTGDLGDDPFPWDEFEPYLNRADELGLYFQYDVRWDYSNLTKMIDHVTRLRSHPSILLWYTGDEPDGKSDPINSTAIAYETIRSLDLYHPVSLALNCYDFYYQDYAAGAEIILSDVYPISTNTSWSSQYDTPCNSTYGCCGCDDCKGVFEDISDRLDQFARFDNVIGWPKTHWSAPQAFGNETFWTRYPTAAEEVVMTMLSINHAAKGIVMWDFPTTAGILDITNKLAAVLTTDKIANFLLGTPLFQTLKIKGEAARVDAAAWVGDEEVLLSIVNLNYGDVKMSVSVQLPDYATGNMTISQQLWGDDTAWRVEGQTVVSSEGMLGLGVTLLLLARN